MKYKLLKDLPGHNAGKILDKEEWMTWLYSHNFNKSIVEYMHWFEPIQEFKEGEWLYCKYPSSECIIRYKKDNGCTISTDEYYQISTLEDNKAALIGSGTSSAAAALENCTKATPEQIERVLTAVAKDKGFVSGVNYISAQYNELKLACGNYYEYDIDHDCLYLTGNTVYYKGKWAEIVKEEPFTLANKKIWIGDNPKLAELVQRKAFEMGWEWYSVISDGKEAIYADTNALFFYEDKIITYGVTIDRYNGSNKTEITPEQLGIKPEEYEVKLITEDGVKLYEDDSYYFIWINGAARGQEVNKIYGSFKIKTSPNTSWSNSAKYFSTKEAAEKWVKEHTECKCEYKEKYEELVKKLDHIHDTLHTIEGVNKSLLFSCSFHTADNSKRQFYETELYPW